MEGPIKCGDQYLQKGEECDCGTKEVRDFAIISYY